MMEQSDSNKSFYRVSNKKRWLLALQRQHKKNKVTKDQETLNSMGFKENKKDDLTKHAKTPLKH